MKPFDLEKALAGDPVVTRDGREVTQIHLFDTTAKHRLFGVLFGEVEAFSIDGRYWDNGDSEADLFMAPKKRTVWVNLYAHRPNAFYYNTQEDADVDLVSELPRIGNKAYPIEIEE